MSESPSQHKLAHLALPSCPLYWDDGGGVGVSGWAQPPLTSPDLHATNQPGQGQCGLLCGARLQGVKQRHGFLICTHRLQAVPLAKTNTAILLSVSSARISMA